jgi:hypothetical protein
MPRETGAFLFGVLVCRIMAPGLAFTLQNVMNGEHF